MANLKTMVRILLFTVFSFQRIIKDIAYSFQSLKYLVSFLFKSQMKYFPKQTVIEKNIFTNKKNKTLGFYHAAIFLRSKGNN